MRRRNIAIWSIGCPPNSSTFLCVYTLAVQLTNSLALCAFCFSANHSQFHVHARACCVRACVRVRVYALVFVPLQGYCIQHAGRDNASHPISVEYGSDGYGQHGC